MISHFFFYLVYGVTSVFCHLCVENYSYIKYLELKKADCRKSKQFYKKLYSACINQVLTFISYDVYIT